MRSRPDIQRRLRRELPYSSQLRLADDWQYTARHNQLPPPGDWRTWLALTGRGWGKNRCLSEFCHDMVAANPGRLGFLAARTLSDVRKVVIGHPEAGLLATMRDDNPCEVKGERVWWANGAHADYHTSEEPDRARGPHTAFGIADEVGTWKRVVDVRGNDTMTNLQFGLRAGPQPRAMVGTTPRPTKLIRKLIDRAERGAGVVLSRGTMFDNRMNLAPSFLEEIEHEYAGTRLYRAEALGEMLLDVEGAILTHELLETGRVDEAPEMAKVVIGFDPAGKGSKKTSDAHGVNVAGRGAECGHLYSIEDLTMKGTPDQVCRVIANAYWKHGADLVVCEDNQGGEWLDAVMRRTDKRVRIQYRSARKSKSRRASGVLACYERGEAHIVGRQTILEDQLCGFTQELTYEGDGSPDDADAHVWAGIDLMLGGQSTWEEMAAANA